jgi:hypothetical protein
MFSRNNNTQENYQLEQRRNKQLYDYQFFENSSSGPAFTTHIQGNGLGIAKLHPKDLSVNYVEVDSYLKGIGSCDFIQPRSFQFQPKQNEFLHIEQREPILLSQFQPISSQRPGFP